MKKMILFIFILLSFQNSRADFLQLHSKESHLGQMHEEIITLFPGELILESSALLRGQKLCSDQGGVYSSKINDKESSKLYNQVKTIVDKSQETKGGQLILLSDQKNALQKEISGKALAEVRKLIDSKLKGLKIKAVVTMRSYLTSKDQLQVVLKYTGNGESFYFPLEDAQGINSVFYSPIAKLRSISPLQNFTLDNKNSQLKEIKLTLINEGKDHLSSGRVYFNTKVLKDSGPYFLGDKLDHLQKVPNLFLCSQILKE